MGKKVIEPAYAWRRLLAVSKTVIVYLLKWGPGAISLTSPGKHIRNVNYPDLLQIWKQKPGGGGFTICFNKPPSLFWYTLKFENSCELSHYKSLNLRHWSNCCRCTEILRSCCSESLLPNFKSMIWFSLIL